MSPEIAWLQGQQRAALEHMKPGHKCSDVQCTPDGCLAWLLDSFAEQLLIEYPEVRR
jgi:hypothetical protein